MRDPAAAAQDLLDRVVAYFDEVGVELPPVQYVAPGATVAFDGPQVTVNIVRIERGQPGGATDQFVQLKLWFAEFQVIIIRATPTIQENGDPPSVVDLNLSSKENITDLRTLAEAIDAILASYEWQPRGSAIEAGPATPLGPDGGIVAAMITILAELD